MKSGKQGGDAVLKFSEHKRKRVDELEADVDALFRLPPAEFTGARNALAAQLKKSGRGDDAARVKALAKPSISAWAVNQLYWNHRQEFDQLIALGERFHKAQKSGKVAEMRTALEARRETLTDLSDLATSLLRDAGQNPAPDTIHRITTTLEGISAYASRSDGRHSGGAGRLTNDVDPPGFESLASFVPGMKSVATAVTGGSRSAKRKQAYPPANAGGTDLATTKTRRKETDSGDVRQKEETRKAKIAAAKVSVQDAKRSLAEARAKVQRLEAAQKKADAEAKKTEQQKSDAEERLEKAQAASVDAARRARKVAVEVKDAARELEGAERAVEATSKELESLFRDSSL
jgi:hypothetical protein